MCIIIVSFCDEQGVIGLRFYGVYYGVCIGFISKGCVMCAGSLFIEL